MSAFHQAAAGLIFLAAMIAVVTRPRHLDESVSASLGAVAMVLTGAVSPEGALRALAGNWDLFLFFLGLMLISGLADAAGFFDAAGVLAAAAARGSGRLLLFGVFAAGALVTAFFSNDATALILTPVVYSVATRMRLPPLPYLFATTFVADTASMTLPVSNPINVVVTERSHIGLATYEGHLLAASVVALALNAGLFQLVFRREAGLHFALDWRKALSEAVPDRRLFRLTCAGLGAVAGAYVLAAAAALPLGVVAMGGAGLLALLALAARRLQPGRVCEHVGFGLLLYVAGLLVLIRGLEEAGVSAVLVGALAGLVRGSGTAVLAGLAGGAVGANLVNNLPATLVLLPGASQLSATLRLPFQLGVLVGADLGPNLTPVGSLSTMLWLVIVRRRGVDVSSLQYLRLGAVVTPVLLLAAGLAVVATFR